MKLTAVLIVAAAVFGLCWLADRGFTKLFRSQAQHKSGLSVRLNKRSGSIGLLVAVLGVTALLVGIDGKEGWALPVCGGALIAGGLCLAVYYLSFGVFYDADSFVLTKFGKGSVTYTYRDILRQQLYNNQGHILIELHLTGGRVLHLQSNMEGVYPFLDFAFARWCEQTGRTRESCDFYDPANSCWFPVEE
ncbi:MAG: hypothetical protein IJX37_00175 [Oscillospiraceae bacterium]|nr:hypothetical protein [Oscillospiraceae bacterium]